VYKLLRFDPISPVLECILHYFTQIAQQSM
jgi:hypothetical protein